MKATVTAFEVLDALGLAQLQKRSGDLGGSVPLRVAQACAPLFEGNAFGFQITLRQPIVLRRSLGHVAVEIAAPYGEAFTAAHRAVLPRLVAQGILRADGLLPTMFADDFVKVASASPGEVRVHLWTGLCVRADAGVWLRVSSTANRRNRFFEVEEYFIADDGAFAPLMLEITLRPDAPDRLRIEGEIGTVAPVAPGARIEEIPLSQAPEIGAAHAAFYDAAYFDAKVDAPTRKYRKTSLPVADERASCSDAPARCRVITVGPAAHTLTGPMPRIVFSNLVPFEASYDGYTLAVQPDESVLRAGAREVERAFAEALGPTFLGENRRAMLYFTKYFTPHPPGEPHFFVKPWAFVQTPPGWSCLLEGVHGEGFDVLRGIVATDVFHATPAVFQVYRSGEPIRVAYGAPLLHVMPIPRRLLQAGFREATLHH
ncbi:hypothetical protein [Variovorax rhizosphaerae]|uniref:Uncharacterized protein n=1 Tax=Variovorax rhizosphaerae TaxID=1836200 RepID=A0ABU8WIZ1_9BURK